MPDGLFNNRRILVVEDEYFIAESLSGALRESGADVLRPVPSVVAALETLEREVLDVVVLDVNLGGEMAHPLGDMLLKCGVPFLFMTGYDQSSLPERFAAVPRLEEPAETRAIMVEVGRLLKAA